MTLGSTIRGIGLGLAAVALYTTITAGAAVARDLRKFNAKVFRDPSSVIELNESYRTTPEGYWWLCAARAIIDGHYKKHVDPSKQSIHFIVIGEKNIGVNVLDAFDRYTAKECTTDKNGNPIDRDKDGFGDDCIYTPILIPKEILEQADKDGYESAPGKKMINPHEAYSYLESVAEEVSKKWF
ncbi:hypothetical protein DSCO28_38760 [Desulfosarcina ovata subsp. sediminis]|uniref:Uncharacterized protein n=1 Tax=Desulfosarcina ovata subsp. sediminis TaxID=885957 RepID=A0A5K7ZSX6_9BACT|nr:hypothetical protein [Desulfosarcina ovata]BBO83310.1 hypothetical protein DSCO28_38760 [Desulfosarcina ovata subsp. sediminis]